MATQPKLSIQAEQHEQAFILCISGRVDGNTAKILESAIQEQVDAGTKTLILDLKDMDYISSAGLRVLLLGARRMQAKAGKTLFCALGENIQQIFEISGFNDILDVRANRDEALAAL